MCKKMVGGLLDFCKKPHPWINRIFWAILVATGFLTMGVKQNTMDLDRFAQTVSTMVSGEDSPLYQKVDALDANMKGISNSLVALQKHVELQDANTYADHVLDIEKYYKRAHDSIQGNDPTSSNVKKASNFWDVLPKKYKTALLTNHFNWLINDYEPKE